MVDKTFMYRSFPVIERRALCPFQLDCLRDGPVCLRYEPIAVARTVDAWGLSSRTDHSSLRRNTLSRRTLPLKSTDPPHAIRNMKMK